MIIFLWIILRILFILAGLALLFNILKSLNMTFPFDVLKNGFKEAFRWFGFTVDKPRLPVELYTWVTCDDDEVCADCQERASWPAMDIADWMKEGLPRTPEACTRCDEDCRCELVRDQSRKPHVHDF